MARLLARPASRWGYDRDGDGCEMMNAGEKLTDEVVDERLREVDLDGNQVDLDQ